MKIGRREVGPGHPVLVVAEIGSNHGSSLDRALALIDAAADAGADAAKFQRFRVDHFLVPRPDPEALRRYELPDDWLPILKSKCQSRDIEFLCTAFDLESLEVVDPFVDAHKVGSYEAGLMRLMVALEATGKPIIASEGIRQGPGVAGEGMPDLIRLRCVSEYPAPIDGYLGSRTIPPRSEFWGVSDHTLHPTIVPAAATALGACVVEKHMRDFGSDRATSAALDGVPPDWNHSIDPRQFAAMVEAIRLTEKAVRG